MVLRINLSVARIETVDELFTIALKTKPVRLKSRPKKPLSRKESGNDISKNLQ